MSWDLPIGGPYNIAQYALLLAMLAQVTGMEPFELIISGGDVHIYLDQLPLIDEQLAREPLTPAKLWLNPEIKSIYDFTMDDIRIDDYQCHPAIGYPVST